MMRAALVIALFIDTGVENATGFVSSEAICRIEAAEGKRLEPFDGLGLIFRCQSQKVSLQITVRQILDVARRSYTEYARNPWISNYWLCWIISERDGYFFDLWGWISFCIT